MSWKDRLQESINLTSPNGNVFNAAWRGDDRTLNKKLGVFTYPLVDGSDVQDLGSNAITYPLTFYFFGPDNDKEATRFFESCKEFGTWEILHPTKGKLNLILNSVTEKIQPIDSGNITEFNSSWIEPLNENAVKSSAQLASETQSQGQNVGEESAGQYDEALSLNTASESISNEQMIENMVLEVDKYLENIYLQNDDIGAAIQSIKTGIIDSLAQESFNAISTAGQIQQLIQLPGLAITDIETRVNAYIGFIESILDFQPSGNRPEDKNTAVVMELATASGLTALCESIISGELKTRSEAIGFIDMLNEIFNQVVTSLDEIQELFISNSIDTQYFSNSQSYSELLKLIGITSLYLLRSALDLKIEKRFILDRKKTPLQITIEEYGELGENDINLDFFNSTNNLYGNEMRLLNAGREIVVYL